MKRFISLALLAMILITSVSCNTGGGPDETAGESFSDTSASPDTENTETETGDETTDVTVAPPVTGEETTLPPVHEPDVAALFAEFSKLARGAYEAGGMKALDPKFNVFEKDYYKVSGAVSGEIKTIYGDMLAEKITVEEAAAALSAYALITGAKSEAEQYLSYTNTVGAGREAFIKAGELVTKGRYDLAAEQLAKIQQSDSAYLGRAKLLISNNSAAFEQGLADRVSEYMVRYRIEQGKSFLNNYGILYGRDGAITAQLDRLEQYRAYQEEGLVQFNMYNGGTYGIEGYENIYTHCLIAFPEINFKTYSSSRNLGPDCLTPDEFRYLLNQLYEKDYVLVDINNAYNKETGARNRYITVPAGKKPLFLTIDDVVYDHRKAGLGMIDKLILDEYGYVCTYTKMKDGSEVISYENEIFPILDAFVREHPDFTFQGARGVLCVTGFDGILGYRTQSRKSEGGYGLDSDKDRAAEIEAVKPVIAAFKEEGWTFGSHSYNHAHMPKYTAEQYKLDFDNWEREVGSLVGETQVFVWPYGDHGAGVLRKGELHKYSFDKGFNIFLGCGAGRYYQNELDGLGMFIDRKGVTGNVLKYIDEELGSYPKAYLYLINPDEMYDKYRLPYRYR